MVLVAISCCSMTRFSKGTNLAGTLALLTPLSIPFLVYAFVSGVSMKALSMAGLVPAILSAIALIIVCT